VSVAVPDDAAWPRFCQALGRTDWLADSSLATLAGRQAREDELDAGIRAWTAVRTAWDVAGRLQAAAIPAGPVLRSDDLIFDPHLEARGFFQVIDQPEAGVRPFPRQLVARFSGMTAGITRHAPLLGEHNAEVLQELLSVSDEEYAALWADDVIGDVPLVQRPTAPMRLDIHLKHQALATLDPAYREKLVQHFHIDPARLADPAGATPTPAATSGPPRDNQDTGEPVTAGTPHQRAVPGEPPDRS
jgi:hypothetical protein